MERRKLLQALAALPAVVLGVNGNGERVGIRYELKPKKRYVVFLNAELVDVNDFCNNVPEKYDIIPPGTSVYPVILRKGKTMDDLCRIYEIEKDSE